MQTIPSAAPAQSQQVPSVAPPQAAEISQLPTFLRSDPQNSALPNPPSDVIQTPISSDPQVSVQPQISMPASVVPQPPVQQASQPAVPGLIPYVQPQPQYPVYNPYAAREVPPPTTMPIDQQPETVTQNMSLPNTNAQENAEKPSENEPKPSENEPKPSMFSSFFSTESPKVINNQENTNKNQLQGSNSAAAAEAPSSQENTKVESAPSIFGSFFTSEKKENTENQKQSNANLESTNENNEPNVGSN